jgi:hypothetical protein
LAVRLLIVAATVNAEVGMSRSMRTGQHKRGDVMSSTLGVPGAPDAAQEVRILSARFTTR